MRRHATKKDGGGERARCRRRAAWLSALGSWGLLICAAGAQVAPVQQGNVLDANPLVGSGGSNRPVQGYVPINGNQIITGNVTGLSYFHGNIPYSSPYDFHGTLGSAALNNFERQSAGAPPGGGTYTGQMQTYYLPSRMVTTDNGRIVPQMGQAGGNGMDSQLLGPATLSPSAARTNAMVTGQRLELVPAGPARFYGPIGSESLAPGARQPNALFGMPGPLDSTINQPQGATPTTSPASAGTTPGGPNLKGPETPVRTDNGVGQQVQGELNTAARVPGRVDQAVAVRPRGQLLGQTNTAATTAPAGDIYTDLLVQLRRNQEKAAEAARTTAPETPQTPAAVVGTGHTADAGRTAQLEIDPLTGQLKMSTPAAKTPGPLAGYPSTNPGAPNYRSPLATPVPGETPAPLTREQTAALQAGRTVTPFTTLVGSGDSRFDEAMSQAEALLKEGRYLEAADRYHGAVELQPNNALAMIGRTHALLAAGLYESAAYNLKALFAQQPELIAVRYDLHAFLSERRVAFLFKDISGLTHQPESNTASFLMAYLNYQTTRPEDLDKLLQDWAQRQPRDRWPAVLRKAWLDKAP